MIHYSKNKNSSKLSMGNGHVCDVNCITKTQTTLNLGKQNLPKASTLLLPFQTILRRCVASHAIHSKPHACIPSVTDIQPTSSTAQLKLSPARQSNSALTMNVLSNGQHLQRCHHIVAAVDVQMKQVEGLHSHTGFGSGSLDSAL